MPGGIFPSKFLDKIVDKSSKLLSGKDFKYFEKKFETKYLYVHP
jgi:hypothetical protein